MKKTTEELLNILKNSSLKAYLKENESELIENPLSSYLNALLSEKSLKKSEVIEKSGIFNVYAYQIFSGAKIPSRDKLISLCMGMELDLDETQTLLKYAGYATLYPRNKRDSVIISALKNNEDVISLNIALDELGLSPL